MEYALQITILHTCYDINIIGHTTCTPIENATVYHNIDKIVIFCKFPGGNCNYIYSGVHK